MKPTSIKRFFHRFHVSSALKQSNAYKKKGIPVIEVFQYLFLLIFSNRSMYMSLVTGKNTPSFAKDTVYRFMKMVQINWIRFTTILAARIIKNAIVPPWFWRTRQRPDNWWLHVWTLPFKESGTACKSIWPCKACIQIWVPYAYTRLDRWEHFYLDQQCPVVFRKQEKPH